MRKPALSMLSLSALLVLTVLTISACNNPSAASPDAEATIAALAASNAALSTQVAELSGALATPTPVAEAVAAIALPSSETAVAPASTLAAASEAVVVPGSTLPRLVANTPLAPEGTTLDDLRLDRTLGRVYVTDTANQLHILDATTFALLTTLPIGGNLELDERNGRLYVYRPFVRDGEEPAIHVIDTATLAEIGVLRGGAIAVDAERNRLFVGEPYTYSTPEDAPGVRVIDGATLQVIGEIDQPGAPVYNPERNELLIVAYTVYTADPDRLEVTGDLFPDLTNLDTIGFLWCNSCRWADNAWYLPEQGAVAIQVSAHCAGKGCGVEELPRWYDAATMQPIDAAVAPELQSDCGTAVSAVGAIGDRLYRNRVFNRYMVYTNFYVSEADGAPITWRDGLSTEFINAHTGQGYLFDGRVIDLASLTPVGRWPAACIMQYDSTRGLIYAKREGSLYVIDERGGALPETAPPVEEPLPDVWITGLHVSPAFAVDSTLLAESETGALYRSTNGGASWMRLRGGLPDDEYQNLYAAFSPNFGVDRSIYVTGHRGDYWGYGVWRSTDGGDTWAPLWNNLIHLRGEEIFFSNDYATNQTLVMRARFNDVVDQVSGTSYQQSTDGGLSWTLVVTGGYSTAQGQVPLPPVSELLPGGPSGPVVGPRLDDDRRNVFYTPDGSTWLTATVTPAVGDLLLAMLPSPDYASDATAYAVSQSTIWRTLDGGATWTQWQDERFAAPDDFTNKIRSAAITPVLAGGGYRIFVGTGGGAVIALDPAAMAWEETPATVVEAPAAAVEPSVQSALPTPTPGALEAPIAEALTGEPPDGLYRPEGDLALLWNDNERMQQDLGWATEVMPTTSPAAIERFDNGVMIWVQETGRIYAFLNDGRWRSYEDTFVEGDPESDPAFAPPDGRQQPVRGFGKVWREHADLRDAIGWAVSKEEPATALRQSFERGAILRVGVFAYTMTGNGPEGTWY